MDPIFIRAATEADRTWAAALLHSQEPWTTLGVSFETCLKNCSDPDLELFIAWRNEDRCAMLLVHPKGLAGSPYIKSIATDPGFRGSGAGLDMMHFAEERYGQHTGHLGLCVSSFNTRARAFYEKLGYRKVGEIPDYIIAGASEWIMIKKTR
jgi:ribosomal-protein-alanine N-acetyltransferase